MTPNPADQLDLTAFAARAGIKPGTIYGYHSTGRLPQPDGWLGRTPWWWADTVDAWLTNRPGQGWRGKR